MTETKLLKHILKHHKVIMKIEFIDDYLWWATVSVQGQDCVGWDETLEGAIADLETSLYQVQACKDCEEWQNEQG